MTTGSLGERGADPILGSTLDNYRFVRRIGVGGMGVVYLVEHTRLKKQFAAKVLASELASSREALSRFETEAKAASQLEHENIVSVTDYGLTADGRPYIVMELLRGRTLDERIVEGPLTLPEIVAIIVPLCRALACAHADGIVHRDVKPDNIFLTDRGNGRFGIKVLDFGIAKAPLATGRVTKHGQSIGSPHYMAPEACRGEDVDHRVDIYSVGVLMYLLFTGRVPFHDENFLKLLQMQVLAQPVPPRELVPVITPAIEKVILRAMAKNPDERYLSIDHLLKDFEQAVPPDGNELLVEDARISLAMPALRTPSTEIPTYRTPIPGLRSPVAVHSVVSDPDHPPTPRAAPVVPHSRRSRAPVIALVALVLVAAGGSVWYLTRDSGTSAPAVADNTPPSAPVQPPTPPKTVDPPQVAAAPSTPRVVGRPKDLDPPAAKKVHVKITSKPTRALIKVDEVTLGRTPLEADLDERDAAKLEVSADGYKSENRKLVLDSDQTIEIALDRTHVAEPAHASPPRHPAVVKANGSAATPPPPPSGDLEIRDHR
jgi:eukaryotic-like serine/threonine-protein kinase